MILFLWLFCIFEIFHNTSLKGEIALGHSNKEAVELGLLFTVSDLPCLGHTADPRDGVSVTGTLIMGLITHSLTHIINAFLAPSRHQSWAK